MRRDHPAHTRIVNAAVNDPDVLVYLGPSLSNSARVAIPFCANHRCRLSAPRQPILASPSRLRSTWPASRTSIIRAGGPEGWIRLLPTIYQEHRAALEACLDQASAGHGQLVLLHGEAGIGKPKLVDALRARAAARGAPVVKGACFDADRALPFGPFIDLLRDVLAEPEAASTMAVLGAATADLALLPPTRAAPEPYRQSAEAGVQHKRRLFHALERLFAHLASRRPLVQSWFRSRTPGRVMGGSRPHRSFGRCSMRKDSCLRRRS